MTLGTWHSRALPAGRCGGLALLHAHAFADLCQPARSQPAWREANRQRWRIFERT